MTSIHRALVLPLAVASICVIEYATAGIGSGATVATSKPPEHQLATAKSASAPSVHADLRQLMRGVVFPSANVIFAAQEDPNRFPKVEDPTVSPNPLTSSYGGWEAVQNAALAIGEATNLLMLPGRMCSSHHIVPVERADWQRYVLGLRDAANVAYKASLTKSTDAMLEASDTLSQACMTCHEVYREKESKGGDKNRCLP